jgi:WD40 repeat protein
MMRVLLVGCLGFVAIAGPVDSASAQPSKKDPLAELKDRTGQLRVFSGHDGPVRGVVFSADAKTLITGGYDRTVRHWDVVSGKNTFTSPKLAGRISSMAPLPVKQGKRVKKVLVIVASDNSADSIFIWDASSKASSKKLTGVAHGSGAVSASADGKFVVGVHGGGIDVWESATGLRIRNFDSRGFGGGLALSSDARYVAIATEDNQLECYELKSQKPMRTFKGHTGAVTCAVFTSDGKKIVSGSVDGTIRVWDVQTSEEIRTLKGHVGSVRCLAISASDTRVLSGGDDGSVRLWDLTNGQLFETLEGHKKPVNAVSFSPEIHLAASASEDGTAILWGLSK